MQKDFVKESWRWGSDYQPTDMHTVKPKVGNCPSTPESCCIGPGKEARWAGEQDSHNAQGPHRGSAASAGSGP